MSERSISLPVWTQKRRTHPGWAHPGWGWKKVRVSQARQMRRYSILTLTWSASFSLGRYIGKTAERKQAKRKVRSNARHREQAMAACVDEISARRATFTPRQGSHQTCLMAGNECKANERETLTEEKERK